MRALLVLIGIVLVVALGIFAGWVYFQPDELKVEKKLGMNAPPEVVYQTASALRQWPEWWKSGKIADKAKLIPGGNEEGSGQSLTIDIPGAPIVLTTKAMERPSDIKMTVVVDQYTFNLTIRIDPSKDGSAVTMRMARAAPGLTFAEKLGEALGSQISKTIASRLNSCLNEMRQAVESK